MFLTNYCNASRKLNLYFKENNSEPNLVLFNSIVFALEKYFKNINEILNSNIKNKYSLLDNIYENRQAIYFGNIDYYLSNEDPEDTEKQAIIYSSYSEVVSYIDSITQTKYKRTLASLRGD